MSETITPAHTERETLHLTLEYPAHEPRKSDVHYKYFNEARARLEKLGAWKCWIGNADCDTQHPLEAHHALIEFSLIGDVDEAKFEALYPEFGITDDESFLRFVEEEHNLTILCRTHHRSTYLGVHFVPYPGWVVQRFLKAGVAAPAHGDQTPTPDPQPPVAGVPPEAVAVTVAPPQAEGAPQS